MAALRQGQHSADSMPERRLVRVAEALSPLLSFTAIGYGYGMVINATGGQTSSGRMQGVLVGAALLTVFVLSLQWVALRDTVRLTETLRQQSIRDPLTGLFNRRFMEEALLRELLRAERLEQSLSVIMLDIDHFKRFNDTFGHDAGDLVLRQVGAFLHAHIRGADIACRYGGEEFILVLPGASLAAAQARADQLRLVTRDLVLQYEGQSLGTFSFSIGVAGYPEHGRIYSALLRAADEALYRAKRAGRDRVVVAQ